MALNIIKFVSIFCCCFSQNWMFSCHSDCFTLKQNIKIFFPSAYDFDVLKSIKRMLWHQWILVPAQSPLFPWGTIQVSRVPPAQLHDNLYASVFHQWFSFLWTRLTQRSALKIQNIDLHVCTVHLCFFSLGMIGICSFISASLTAVTVLLLSLL